ncbi:MAG: hypothetical protein HFH84_02170 [Lachnospiraceae bacterium]|jgi:hypothetical protein|nr:hypothetical protein [Lachnospiraceae bacterium]
MEQESIPGRPSFISAVSLDRHPMRLVGNKEREHYYIVLEYFVKQFEMTEYITSRLGQYQDMLLGKREKPVVADNEIDSFIRAIVNGRYQAVHKNNHFQPWKKKHRRQFCQRIYHCYLMCDFALILFDVATIHKAADSLKKYLTRRQVSQLDILLFALTDSKADIKSIPIVRVLFEQYHKNKEFLKKPEMRMIVTSNISVGKSTLINALIGKAIARTSQEVCTGNICYIYNKPFEDNQIQLKAPELMLNATKDELRNYEWDLAIEIGSYFRTCCKQKKRLCIIDTPGVNSTLNKNHGVITRNALKSERYDKFIHVLNAHKLGTDEEINHLRWVSENLPSDKAVFVVNKLDDFQCTDDNVAESLESVRIDLVNLGYKEPVICPLSAYAAFLTKLKYSGVQMTDEQNDDYQFFVKKFRKPVYDLSPFYDGVFVDEEKDSEYISMCKRTGLFGLEKILWC